MTTSRKLGGIFLLALVIRLALLAHLGGSLPADYGQLKSWEYFLAGNGFSEAVPQPNGEIVYEPTARDLPGHGIVIIATWLLTGTRSLVPLQLLQILLDACMVFFLYSIGRRLFSERIGLLTALCFALYLPEATLAVWARRDVWVSYGAIVSFYCVLRYAEALKWKYILTAGIVLAWTTYFRSTMILFPAALGLGLALRIGWRRALFPTAVMTALIVIGLLPWGIRNYHVLHGRFLLTELNFNQSMWEGFGQFPNPVGAVNNDALTEQRMRAEGYTGRFATVEYEDFLRPKVARVIREHPGWYLGTAFRRIPRALLLNRVHWGVLQKSGMEFHKFHLEHGGSMSMLNYALQMVRLDPGFLITKAADSVILVLAMIGLWVTWRSHWRTTLMLASLPALFIVTLMPIRIEGRYMVPVHWVFLMGMAVALAAFWDRWRRKESRWASR